MKFELKSTFKPSGDQPKAIKELVSSLKAGHRHQTLLGVTGSGKTFTLSNVISIMNKPTLVISHNKTLAAQLYQEFKEFFPKNSVNYFVSYYDYYQPEAYLPQTDTYIEKETEINEEIDKLRLGATVTLLSRRDVIVVASVSCIYNIGSPHEYYKSTLKLAVGDKWERLDFLRKLTRLHYFRNDLELIRGTFRVRGDQFDLFPAYEDLAVRFVFNGDVISKMFMINPISGEKEFEIDGITIYPAKHYIASEDIIELAFSEIMNDLKKREDEFKAAGKELFANRIYQRTIYDLEQIKELGYCKGIENYSRYFDRRAPGEPPHTLLDYFPSDYLTIVDESHITIPQIRGMYNQDKARKETLIEFGFRLPSALDNRPLKFDEFLAKSHQIIYSSATPAEWELTISEQIVEQLVRPTGLVDPPIHIRSVNNQISDLISEIEIRVARKERVLVTTLTKRMAEDLSDYLQEQGFKVHYLHSEIDTLDRVDIIDDLRLGKFDVIVGINLLREGLDLPEVSLVAILDADKEGFLRSKTSLIQVMGRAARHITGEVIMYADSMTNSIKAAISEIERRRAVQIAYNKKHKIIPQGIVKPIREKLVDRPDIPNQKDIFVDRVINEAIKRYNEGSLLPDEREKLIKILTREMKDSADRFDFERAAVIRDQLLKLKSSSSGRMYD